MCKFRIVCITVSRQKKTPEPVPLLRGKTSDMQEFTKK